MSPKPEGLVPERRPLGSGRGRGPDHEAVLSLTRM